MKMEKYGNWTLLFFGNLWILKVFNRVSHFLSMHYLVSYPRLSISCGHDFSGPHMELKGKVSFIMTPMSLPRWYLVQQPGSSLPYWLVFKQTKKKTKRKRKLLIPFHRRTRKFQSLWMSFFCKKLQEQSQWM